MDNLSKVDPTLDSLWKRDAKEINRTRKQVKGILIWLMRKKKITPDYSIDDLIQEALLRFYNKDYPPELNRKATPYLMGTVWNIIKDSKKKIREKPSPLYLIENSEVVDNILSEMEKVESLWLLQQMIKQLSSTCQKLIELIFWRNLASEEIAIHLGYSSSNVVHSKKYKCLTTLNGLMINNKECIIHFDLQTKVK